LGLGLGLGLGVLVVGGLEFIDDRLHSEKAIKALLPMKVISEIPDILTPSDERRSKRMMWLGWVASVLVFMIILAGSAYSYLRS
jgi:succinoglycan biosynthesis transport protein ExoP